MFRRVNIARGSMIFILDEKIYISVYKYDGYDFVEILYNIFILFIYFHFIGFCRLRLINRRDSPSISLLTGLGVSGVIRI